MSTQATFGHRLCAWRRKSTSGAVSSWLGVRDEQDQRPRSAAIGHRRAVVPRPDATDARRVDEDQAAGQQRARQLDLRVREPPLVPGIGRLAHDLRDLEDFDRLADELDLRDRRHPGQVARARIAPTARDGPPPARPRGARRPASLSSGSPCRTIVGTEVAMSSSTAQMGAFTIALTSRLLPCLNSPTTSARMPGWASRLDVWDEPFDQVGTVGRRCRGARPFDELPQWLQRICPHAFAARRTRPRTVDRRSDRERLLHIPHMNRPRELVRSSRGRSCGVSGCRLSGGGLTVTAGYSSSVLSADDDSRIADCNVVVVERLLDLECRVVGVVRPRCR